MGQQRLSRIAICNWCNQPVYRKALLRHFRDGGCPQFPGLKLGELVCSMCQKIKDQAVEFYRDSDKPHRRLSRCIECCRDYHQIRKQAKIDNLAQGIIEPETNRVNPGGWVLRPCPHCGELFSFNQLVHHRPRCPKHPHPRKVQETTSNAKILEARDRINEPLMDGITRVRFSNIKRAYGITKEDFDRMLVEQNGLCAICGKPPSGSEREQHLHVDHSHKTNKPRGLLCRACNHGIGNFNDDEELILKAIAYLRRHAAMESEIH